MQRLGIDFNRQQILNHIEMRESRKAGAIERNDIPALIHEVEELTKWKAMLVKIEFVSWP